MDGVVGSDARSYVVTHLPGDGVGPEVTDVARLCVDAMIEKVPVFMGTLSI